ncbi:MAG: hypothetical protein QF733_05190 [Phycisphaerales bacterium]|jgi:hypothetical protein|nr:hypothetical protein [Phycisphaerales bacterium]
MRRVLTPATIVLTAFAATASADAIDGVGLSASVVGTNLVEGVGENYTIRLWAELPAGWSLEAVAGNAALPMHLTPLDGTFFQAAFGGATSMSNNPAFYPIAPDVEWDTFLTIGRLTTTDNALREIGMDWANFESGGAHFADNGSIYILPVEVQGEPVTFQDACGQDREGVLIGQFTMLGATASLSGSFFLQAKDELGQVQRPEFASFAVGADGHTDVAVTPACSSDLDGDDRVSVTDLLTLLEQWYDGPCADISGDAVVDAQDVMYLVESWGACPE